MLDFKKSGTILDTWLLRSEIPLEVDYIKDQVHITFGDKTIGILEVIERPEMGTELRPHVYELTAEKL